MNVLFSNRGGYGTEIFMGTEVSRTSYDSDTPRRNQYDFVYRRNISASCLGESKHGDFTLKPSVENVLK